MQKAYSSEIKRLGEKIKAIRISKNMTQQTLADLCEIDIRTVQRIEKGEFGIGLHILFAIAEAFEFKAYDLLKEDKDAR